MTQYNLRLDEKTKEKAQYLAKNRGVSENSLYQTAIEEFLAKTEAAEFYTKLMNRIVTPQEKKQIVEKLKKNPAGVIFKEDK